LPFLSSSDFFKRDLESLVRAFHSSWVNLKIIASALDFVSGSNANKNGQK
jgi:hypothetical protein